MTHRTNHHLRRHLSVILITPFLTQARAFHLQMSSMTKSVKLSHIQNDMNRKDEALTGSKPSTLFIHGLDSSSHTWRSTLQRLSSPGVAIDCRGCGSSPLGNAKDFTPEALTE